MSKVYAELAAASYDRAKSPQSIDSFECDRRYGQANSSVYVSPDTVALCIRGTNPKNPEDLLSDVAIVTGSLRHSRRYKEISARFKQIIKDFPNLRKIVIGHSLGGSLASQLLVDYEKYIDSIYIFNPGAVPIDIIKGLKTKLFAALGIKFYKKLKRKTHLFYVKGDIISFLTKFSAGKHNNIDSTRGIAAHSLDNFLKDAKKDKAPPPEVIKEAPEPVQPIPEMAVETKIPEQSIDPQPKEPMNGSGLVPIYAKMSRAELIHLLAACNINGKRMSKYDAIQTLKGTHLGNRELKRLLKRHNLR